MSRGGRGDGKSSEEVEVEEEARSCGEREE